MKPSRIAFEHHWVKTRGKSARNDLKRHPLQPDVYVNDAANRHWVTWQAATTPQPKQEQGEPVAYLNPDDLCADTAFRWCKIDEFTQPVYTTPQQRKPLTDEQINKSAMKLAECMDYPWAHMPEEGKREMRNHAKAVIEAAHGISQL